jgi:hypothetical protein
MVLEVNGKERQPHWHYLMYSEDKVSKYFLRKMLPTDASLQREEPDSIEAVCRYAFKYTNEGYTYRTAPYLLMQHINANAVTGTNGFHSLSITNIGHNAPANTSHSDTKDSNSSNNNAPEEQINCTTNAHQIATEEPTPHNNNVTTIRTEEPTTDPTEIALPLNEYGYLPESILYE